MQDRRAGLLPATDVQPAKDTTRNSTPRLQGAPALKYLTGTDDGRSLAKAATAARFGLKWHERSDFGDEGGGYLGMSHVQNLNAWFDGEGMTIRPTLPEDERDKAWRFGMRLKAYGYGAQLTAAPPIVSQKVKENRIEYERANCQSPIANCRFENIASGGALSVLKSAIGNRQSSMTEWYENRAAGIEQGFTIDAPPDRAGLRANEPLRLLLAVEGDLHARANTDRGDIELLKTDGSAVLSYGQLAAKDSAGQLLPARMEVNGDGNEIDLIVQDAGAAYPIVIDPITATQEGPKLTKPGAPQAGTEFGDAVAISGNVAVIGAFREDYFAVDSGSIYVFTRSGSTWTSKFVINYNVPGAQCGWSVAINPLGDKVAFGCPGENSNRGSATFLRTSNNWSTAEGFPSTPANDLKAGDRYGEGVAITNNSLAVGAPFADTGNPPKTDNGAIYFFDIAGGNPTYPEFNGFFPTAAHLGATVAIDGNYGIAGAPGMASQTGGAQIYEYGSSDDGTFIGWLASGFLTANDGSANDLFGYSVAISGNTAVVGAPLDDNAKGTDAGAAYVYVRAANGSWTQQQKLIPSDGIEYDQFGQSVAIERNTIVVGSPYNGSKIFTGTRGNGRTYVFMRNIDTWSEQTIISALFDGAPHDQFGIAVAFSGDTVISGAEHATGGNFSDAGGAYIHRLSCVPPASSGAWAGSPTVHVQSASICPGSSIQLFLRTVNSTNAPLSYQWRKNGVNIGGATDSKYNLINASASDAGSYDLIVSDSCGAEISTPFTLSVYSFAVFPATQNIGYAGNTGLLAVNATGSCPWTAVSNASWITVTSGASGTGNGNVGFRVDPNPGTSQRTATVTVAGVTVTFTQDGAPTGPTIFLEQGTNLLAAVDSVTFVRGPFTLTDDHNFSSDHRTRIIFFTSDLGFTQPSQPNLSILSVEVGGFSVPVERVGPFSFPVFSGSYIVVRLPDLPPGDWPLSIRLNGVNSANSPTLSIRAGP